MTVSSESPRLRRALGLGACTLMGVGVILGAGIYALVGKAAALAGNAVWISFLAAALFSALTGLSYAELSSFIPRAGGQYHFVRRAFGEGLAFVVAVLLLGGIAVVSSTVALGFAGYFRALTGAPIVPAAVAILVACTALLVRGIKESAWFAGICTALEVLGLLFVIVVGVPYLGEVDLLEAPLGATGVLTAASLIFFAYIGFEEIVQVSEEARDPTRTIPRAILLSIALTTVLYVLVAVAAVSILGWERLGASDSPLSDVAAQTTGAETSVAMAVIALFSTANTVLVMMLAAARLLWGIAEDGALPAAVARVHGRWRTPWVATAIVSGLAVGLVVGLRRIEVVANVSNCALFVAFAVVNAALIVLRFREPDTVRPFRVPGRIGRVPLLPVVAVLGALVMLVRTGLLAMSLTGALALMGWGGRLLMAKHDGPIDGWRR